MISLPLKCHGFRQLLLYPFIYFKKNNKSVSFVNLSFFLHSISIFQLKSDTAGTLSSCFYILSKPGRPALKRHIICRSSHRRCSVKIGVYRNLIGPRPATLLTKRLWHRCFPVNFAKFLRKPFIQNSSRQLLLNLVQNWHLQLESF